MAVPLGLALGGASLVSSLFRKKPQESPYTSQAAQQYRNLGNVASRYGQQANEYGSIRSAYQPRSLQSVDDYASMLQQGTTDQERARQIGRSTQNVAGNYLGAQSRLASSLGRSGNTGALSGALANLEASRFGAMANAQNQAADMFDQRKLQNQSALTNLLSGVTNQYGGLERQAMGQEAGLYGQLGSAYGNLAAQDNARRQSAYDADTQMLGSGLGSLFGNLGRQSVPYPASTPPFNPGGGESYEITGTFDDPYSRAAGNYIPDWMTRDPSILTRPYIIGPNGKKVYPAPY